MTDRRAGLLSREDLSKLKEWLKRNFGKFRNDTYGPTRGSE